MPRRVLPLIFPRDVDEIVTNSTEIIRLADSLQNAVVNEALSRITEKLDPYANHSEYDRGLIAALKVVNQLSIPNEED
jgi:hypothetical protein